MNRNHASTTNKRSPENGIPEKATATRKARAISLFAPLLFAACVQSNLENAFDMHAAVIPFGLVGFQGESNAANIPPADITRASASEVNDDTISVTWEAVGHDNMAGSAQRYEIGYADASIADNGACEATAIKVDPQLTATAGDMLTYQIDGLTPHIDYYFCVHAYDEQHARNSWILGEMSAHINPAPDDITIASATGTAFDTVRLQWDAVGEDRMSGAATRYEIGYATTPISDDADCDAATILDPGATPVTAGTQITYDLTGLINQTTYYFCIRAHDAEDKGDSWSYGVLSATTPEGTAGWGAWGPFGSCSATCGGGTMTQSRTCDVKANGCAGSTTNTAACNTHACPTATRALFFSGNAGARSCDNPGYHVISVSCTPGQIRFEGFDFFHPALACGAISRGSAIRTPAPLGSSGVGSTTGTCTFSSGIDQGGLANHCENFISLSGRGVHTLTGPGESGFFRSTQHLISVVCQQTP